MGIKPYKGCWFSDYEGKHPLCRADDAVWNLINFMYCLDILSYEVWDHHYTTPDHMEWARKWVTLHE